MTAAIEIQGLVKRYGPRVALDGLSLAVPEGAVFGFLGANGSGKTTTLRILLGLARSTSGDVRVLGQRPGSLAVRSSIGYCPDVPGFLPWMTARDVMESAAALFRIPPAVSRPRIGQLLELAGLADAPGRVSGFSRGMRQRLGLAQSLINAPRLLLLDEPTSALDPMGRRMVLELIAQLRGNTTVFFSTHLLPDVERVCDHVAILDSGRVVTSGPIDEIRHTLGVSQGRIIVEVDDVAALTSALADQSWAVSVAPADSIGRIILTVSDAAVAARRLPAIIVERGLTLYRLEPVEPSLEDVFVDLVGARA